MNEKLSDNEYEKILKILEDEEEIDPSLTEYENKINKKLKNYEKNKDSTIMLIGSTGCGKVLLLIIY